MSIINGCDIMGLIENDTFTGALVNLSGYILNMVKNNEFPIEELKYLKYNINNIRYLGDQCKAFEPLIEQNTKCILKYPERAIIFDTIVKNSNEYVTCLDLLNIFYLYTFDDASYWLTSYCNYTLNNALNYYDDKLLEKRSIAFIKYLEEDVNRDVKIFITGINLQGASDKDLFNLKKGITIRLPNSNDVKLETNNSILDLYLYKSFNVLHMSTAILEFSYNSKSTGIVKQEIDVLLDIFRLYKVQSVIALYYHMNPEISFQDDGTFWANRNEKPNYFGDMDNSDIIKLNLLINNFKEILMQYVNYQSYDNERYRLGSALERYREALISGVDIDSRITLSVSSLELLYKIGDGEIPYRVRLYISALLKIFGFNPIVVYEKIEIAYNIRNAVSHGSRGRNKLTNQEKEELCKTILEYNRISLLIFLQLTKDERNTLLGQYLNNSLFVEETYTKIEEIFNKIKIVDEKEIENKKLGFDEIKSLINKDIMNISSSS